MKICRYNTSNIGAICKGYIRIHRDEESLKHALAAVGPISIGVVAYIEDWKEYKGGVLNIPDCPNTMKYISHAVVLVGYGQENGMDYWLVLHGKNYQGLEDQVRKAIFEENLKKIVYHNLEYDLGMHSYYLGINEYSDWSSQELTKHMNGLIRSKDRLLDLYEPSGKMELPSSLDWRSKGYVTEVKDQGDCGSCWAFSATGALEGQHYRKTGKLVSLSEQNLVDCSSSEGNAGCSGGDIDAAYTYVMENNGIDTDESYPYLAENGTCHYNKDSIGATLKGYKYIAKDEQSLQQALAAVGPISIAIDASEPEFHQYKGGVYNNPKCKNDYDHLDHAVLLVGYGQENGIDYWLVKNSWGESWGNKGYIKMSRNKNNQCGIATYASYPIV
ncbi:hypothetical protein LAZ67_1002895 [Cordylochernes scorpioides]|uniref:Cathepsin L n=1 Tax=Cordylochernes scorpioides TaxID=51811 RepID=A0ABY6JWF2_9ARAC|nr:hypothetical protein LAZ67_1002895 [Cordylochernes scorpioides]